MVKGLPDADDPLPDPDTAREMIENGVGDSAMIQATRMNLQHQVIRPLEHFLKNVLMLGTIQDIPDIRELTPVITEAAAKLRHVLKALKKAETGSGAPSSDSPDNPAEGSIEQPADGE